jgi:hypothetical protein
MRQKWTNKNTLFNPVEIERILHDHIAPKATPLRYSPRKIKKRLCEARSQNWILVKDGKEILIFNLAQFARDNQLDYSALWLAWNRGYEHEGYQVRKQ